MKEKTSDIVNRSVGEVDKTEATIKKLGKKFNTGQDIAKECAQYEQLIEREGTDILVGRIDGIRAQSGETIADEPETEGTIEDQYQDA